MASGNFTSDSSRHLTPALTDGRRNSGNRASGKPGVGQCSLPSSQVCCGCQCGWLSYKSLMIDRIARNDRRAAALHMEYTFPNT